MNEKFEPLTPYDVVTIKNEQAKLKMPHVTFQINEFATHLISKIEPFANDETKKWSLEGINAEVLAAGKGLRKGKVRLTMEFCPDEQEELSLLDQLHNQLFGNQ